MDTYLDRVNIISDKNQLSLFVFDQSGNVVDTVFNHEGFFTLVDFFAIGSGFSGSGKTSLLFLFGFGAVFVQEFESLGSGVFVHNTGELVKNGGNLQTLLEDSLLTLETDVFGPFNETRKITFGLNVLTDTKVLGGLFSQRIFGGFGDFFSTRVRSGGNLFG